MSVFQTQPFASIYDMDKQDYIVVYYLASVVLSLYHFDHEKGL